MSYEVTLKFALGKWKGQKIPLRSAQRMLKEEGVVWRSLREKPFLTDKDVEDRAQFANRYGSKSARFWECAVSLDGRKLGLSETTEEAKGGTTVKWELQGRGEEGGVTAGGTGRAVSPN